MADALTYNRFTKPSKSAGYSEVQLRPLMLKTLPHQVIALAGLFQALLLVQRIAKRGEADREEMETAVSSILLQSNNSFGRVYRIKPLIVHLLALMFFRTTMYEAGTVPNK